MMATFLFICVTLSYPIGIIADNVTFSKNNAGLQQVPSDIPSNTTSLYLMNNQISNIAATDLENLTSLLVLDL